MEGEPKVTRELMQVLGEAPSRGGQNPSVLTLILATADAPLLIGSRTPPTGP